MSDEIRQLGEGVIYKLEAYGYNDLSFTYYRETYLNNRDQKSEYFSLKGYGKKDRYLEFLETLTEKEQQIEIGIDFGPQVGDQCPDFSVKIPMTGEDKYFVWTEDDCKVYLISFWTTWNGPCNALISSIQKMMEENKHWEGKVEAVCVSLDDNMEIVNNRIKERKWDKVTSYWAGELKYDAESSRKFDVNQVPKCTLVRNGKVLWLGNPSERKLEDDINGLIQGNELLKNKSEDPENVSYNQEELDIMFEKARAKQEEFKQAHSNLKPPGLIAIYEWTLKKATISESYKFYVTGRYLTKYKNTGDSIFREFTEIFPFAKSKITYEEASIINRGDHCNLCNKNLNNHEIQYLCMFCEPEHYHCQECHILQRPGTGSAKFAHPHYLFMITESSDQLDEIKYGKHRWEVNNIRTEDPEDRRHKGIGCDNSDDPDGGCDGNVVGTRYKCAHCQDYDLCGKCLAKWITGGNKHMENAAREAGHLKSHVFVVMEFPNR
ncbi:hypothetical protein SteCoe_14508 [Stentor coeruleus]|uniref:Thioredoxin domain-containing protein n=1 Tax=Stentor coeruleus TaxID=5963 RepID=A0A1R2C5V5_9CILI|nr:hypothetical protein SteCoe_14508 [Stentor coeruleus]